MKAFARFRRRSFWESSRSRRAALPGPVAEAVRCTKRTRCARSAWGGDDTRVLDVPAGHSRRTLCRKASYFQTPRPQALCPENIVLLRAPWTQSARPPARSGVREEVGVLKFRSTEKPQGF